MEAAARTSRPIKKATADSTETGCYDSCPVIPLHAGHSLAAAYTSAVERIRFGLCDLSYLLEELLATRASARLHRCYLSTTPVPPHLSQSAICVATKLLGGKDRGLFIFLPLIRKFGIGIGRNHFRAFSSNLAVPVALRASDLSSAA